MRKSLKHLDKYRIEEDRETIALMAALINETDEYLGLFLIDMPQWTKDKFRVIASIDDEGELEHLRISIEPVKRALMAEELEFIDDLFFTEDEKKNIMAGIAPAGLHLWHNPSGSTKIYLNNRDSSKNR